MPTKKKASTAKKKSTTKPKKQTKKTTSSKTTKRKTTAKKSSAKKTVTKKKKTVAKKKTTAKKKVAKKKTTVKKSAVKPDGKSMFVLEMNKEEEKQKMHVFPKKRTLINQLPVVDLDQLTKDTMPEPPMQKETAHIPVHSRLAFYLGVFLGAVVVNAFLVTILAVISA